MTQKFVLLSEKHEPIGIFDTPHAAGTYLLGEFPRSSVYMLQQKLTEELVKFEKDRPTMTVSTKTGDSYSFKVDTGVVPIHYTLKSVPSK